MLNELDKEMEKRGLRYVRYADDFSIYTNSHSEARKTGNEIYLFLKDKLKLPINRKTTPATFGERIQKLNELQRGWLGYFRMASIQDKLKELDGWVRNRLRYCIWHDRKGHGVKKMYSGHF